MNILVLYTEIAGYVRSCFERFISLNPDYHIHLVRYPVNSEAPFQFENSKGITFYERNELKKQDLLDLAKKLNPHAIITSGWIDKDYVKVCKAYAGKCPTVVLFDNHWTGSKKQQVWKTLFKIKLLKSFSHVWVPGEPQVKYALKLGFKKKKIKTGFYCADIGLYQSFYNEQKHKNFPKRFICVARYIPEKNLETLWQAFKELKLEGKMLGWELWCLGAGSGFETRTAFEGLHHKGFVQPSEMGEYIQETSIFVLPSKFEPWAVAVHEFAAAGFPMILSKKVGAASAFLEERKNGFLFDPLDVTDLKNQLQKFEYLSPDDYQKFSKKSVELSQTIHQNQWSDTLLEIINNK